MNYPWHKRTKTKYVCQCVSSYQRIHFWHIEMTAKSLQSLKKCDTFMDITNDLIYGLYLVEQRSIYFDASKIVGDEVNSEKFVKIIVCGWSNLCNIKSNKLSVMCQCAFNIERKLLFCCVSGCLTNHSSRRAFARTSTKSNLETLWQ